ncbi:MAG: PD-(D/E)XK nuclease family protein [Fimbriimonadales bacterium]
MQFVFGASFRALWETLSPTLGCYGQVLVPAGATRLLQSQNRQVHDWHGFLRQLTGVALAVQPTPEMTALLSKACDQHLTDASYFGKVRHAPRFHSALASSFCRWSMDGLTPDLLEQGAAEVAARHSALAQIDDPDLLDEWRRKTDELTQLWRAWQSEIQRAGMPNPVRGWRALLNALESAEIAYPLLLFGFTELAAMELAALRVLDGKTAVTLALLYDPAHPEQYAPTETILRDWGEPTAFTTAPNADAAASSPAAHMTILDTPNPLTEVETIAREILRLQASGVALNEIALLIRQPESALEALEVIFARYGIPMQGEVSLSLERSWRVRWLMQGLRLLADIGEGADWLHWLEHPLHHLRYEAIANLRQRVRRRIAAQRWLEQAVQHAADADAQRLLTEMRVLQQRLSNHALPQVAHALLKRLSQGETPSRDDADLSEWSQLVNAYTHEWRQRMPAQAVELLEQLVSGARYTHKLGDYGVRLVPMEYADLCDARVAFAMGVLEGNLPKRCPDDPFLRESERDALNRALNAHGVRLPTRADAQAAEPMLFQRLLHAAAEQLYCSYPRTQSGDSDALPSFYLEELKAQHGDRIEVRFYQLEQMAPPVAECLHAYDRSLAQPMNDTEPPPILRHSALRQRVARTDRQFSVTELETLTRCSFQHFARYVLRLRAPSNELSVRDVGTLIHAALCRAVRSSEPNQSAAQWTEQLTQQLRDLLRYQSPDLPDWQIRVLRALVGRLARRFGRREPQYQAQFGVYPHACEWAFGDTEIDDEERAYAEPFHNRGAPRPVPYRLADGSEIRLRGVIDRIDLSPDQRAALVIDYKLGGAPTAQEFRNGRAVQGLLYLHAVRTILPRAGIALAYDRLKAGKRVRFAPSTLSERFRRLSDEDASEVNILAPIQWRQAEQALRSLLTQAIGKLRAADIEPQPDPQHCRVCPYSDLCRKAHL